MTDHDYDRERPARFISLTIENFRGVRDAQTFDLDAAIIVFWGPNGTGKTTVFDALLWLLQGELPRLAAHSLRKTDEYVVSAYKPGSVARVSARFIVAGGVVEVVRQGDSRSTVLTIDVPAQADLSGPDAELAIHSMLSEGGLPLPELMATSGLLQQDDLRQLLRDKPDARYRQLLRLLGLESLEQFEKFVESDFKQTRVSMQFAKTELEKQRYRLREVDDQISTVRSLAESAKASPFDLESLSASVERAAALIDIPWPISSASELEAVSIEIADAQQRVDRILERLGQLPEDLPPLERVDPRLNQAETDAIERLSAAEAALSNAKFERDSLAESHDRLVALVAAAIPILETATHDGHAECPVCQTVIDTRAVVDGLSNRSSAGSLVAEAEVNLTLARGRVAVSQTVLAEARRAREAAEQARQVRLSVERLASQIASDIRRLGFGELVRAKFVKRMGIADPGPDLVPWINENRSILSEALQACSGALVDLLSSTSAASRRANAREDSVNRAGQLPRLEAQQRVLAAEYVEQQNEYERVRKEEMAANSMRHATAAGTEEIFRERFEAIEPLMNDIYGRLDPHPTFTRLDFAIDRYRSKGTATASVTDETVEVRANPLLVFSSAQANVVVLSAFLALGWAAARQGLPFVLMDDPLQSLDDVNVLGFADLVRQLRREKQIFLSTHEERFARLLERKLSPETSAESVIVHRFLGWSREGPSVESRRLTPSTQETDLAS